MYERKAVEMQSISQDVARHGAGVPVATVSEALLKPSMTDTNSMLHTEIVCSRRPSFVSGHQR